MTQDLENPGGSALHNVDQLITPDDLDKIGTMAEQSLWSGFVARLTGGKSGFFSVDFAPFKSGTDLQFSVFGGMGIIDPEAEGAAVADAREPSYVPVYRSAGEPALAVTAHDGANPRIDIVVVAPLSVNDTASSLKIFDGSTGFNLISHNQRRRRNATLTIVAGTPAASPVAPAVPAGSVIIATINVPAVSGAITVTDSRTQIGIRGDAFETQRMWVKPDVIGSEVANAIEVTLQVENAARIYAASTSFAERVRVLVEVMSDDTMTVDSAVFRITAVDDGTAVSPLNLGRCVVDWDASLANGVTVTITDFSASVTSQAWLKTTVIRAYGTTGTLEPTVHGFVGFTTMTRLDFN